MTKEHKIRIALAGLHGPDRALAMLSLCQHPEAIVNAHKVLAIYRLGLRNVAPRTITRERRRRVRELHHSGMTQKEIAALMGVTRQRVNQIVNGE